jgi:hypothetical protein
VIFVLIQDYTIKNIIHFNIPKKNVNQTCKIGGGPTDGRIGNSGNELIVDSARSGVFK